MEKAFVQLLGQEIPELKDNIYPTNAPEDAGRPYLVYYRYDGNITKTLNGYTRQQTISYMFSVMAQKYGDMIRLRDQVLSVLINLPEEHIGENNSIYVQDLTINDINETWESALKVHRGIIDFTITIGG